jgi:hypothetical protein
MWGNPIFAARANAMSINGIGNYQISANALYAGQNTNPVQADGDTDRSRITAPTTTSGRSGLFSSAITQTLFQIGVTPAAANVATGAAPTNTQQQALNSFVQNLFGALQNPTAGGANAAGAKTSATSKKEAKSASQAAPAAGGNSSAGASASANVASAPGSNLEGHLQTLIQQLGSGASGDSTDASAPDDLANLQESYQNLVSSHGGSSNTVPLGSFLQTLSQNLQDIPPTGSLISTSA